MESEKFILWKQRLEWLLDGLEIEQKHAHHSVCLSTENTCF